MVYVENAQIKPHVKYIESLENIENKAINL
jgi:hypothetical protein